MNKTIFVAAAVALALAGAPAQAQDNNVRDLAGQCVTWAESHICVAKAGCPSWQWVAACLVKQIKPGAEDDPRLAWCTNAITQQRWRAKIYGNQGHPIADTLACLQGGQANAE
jgi:hypothetical protein